VLGILGALGYLRAKPVRAEGRVAAPVPGKQAAQL
jgi:hypothetical protein